MKVIILSAGQGKRLLPLTSKTPKCLLDICGKTLLEWQVETLTREHIDDIVVVTGYGAHKVEQLVQRRLGQYRIRTFYNPDYATADNLVSCWKVRHEMDQDFILLNGDTLFEPAVLAKLLASPPSPITVTVSSKKKYDSDDMKVITKAGRLMRIGKQLPAEQVSAESIGLIYFRGRGPEIFRSALRQAIDQPEYNKKWYLSVIDQIAPNTPVMTCSITGLSWCEIDYPKDLKLAEPIVSAIELDGQTSNGHNIYAQKGFVHAKGSVY